MKVIYNPDTEMVKTVKEGLESLEEWGYHRHYH